MPPGWDRWVAFDYEPAYYPYYVFSNAPGACRRKRGCRLPQKVSCLLDDLLRRGDDPLHRHGPGEQAGVRLLRPVCAAPAVVPAAQVREPVRCTCPSTGRRATTRRTSPTSRPGSARCPASTTVQDRADLRPAPGRVPDARHRRQRGGQDRRVAARDPPARPQRDPVRLGQRHQLGRAPADAPRASRCPTTRRCGCRWSCATSPPPRKPPTDRHLIVNIDWAPTLAAIAGAEHPPSRAAASCRCLQGKHADATLAIRSSCSSTWRATRPASRPRSAGSGARGTCTRATPAAIRSCTT